MAFLFAILFRCFLFEPFNTPSSSMEPTLLRGDYFFVAKWSYGYSNRSFPFGLALFPGRIFPHEPRRGDVIIFRDPRTELDFVKRVIGLPGDKIEIAHARLIINGQMVERRKVEPAFTSKSPFGQAVEAATYDEILPGGRTHRIIQLAGDNGYLSNTGVYETPAGSYFVLGDNRDNSNDSRVAPDKDGVGFVSSENIIGEAATIYFSVTSDQSSFALRTGRIGLGVQ